MISPTFRLTAQRSVMLMSILGLASCSFIAQPDAKVESPIPSVAPAAAPTDTVSRPETPQAFDLTRPDIASFINEMAMRHSLDESEIRELLSKGLHQPQIIAAISRPAESVLSWWQYRARLVSAERIARGADFWRTHRERLEAIEAQTGVEAAYLVAIVGIETNYGRTQGSWRVLDALMTLGFDYPPRSRFFRSELEQFVLLAREESLDPLETRGSYAGAMGAPQFMPSSYRRFAVDGAAPRSPVMQSPTTEPRPKRRDLFNDWDDVLASVANYFLVHGWQPGQPVLVEAIAPAGTMATLERRNLDMNTTIGELRQQGVQPQSDLPDDMPALLVPAELETTENVHIGLRNFHVITRYNRSTLYAMAIHDLAMAIEATLRESP